MEENILTFGHKSPDTDTVCSAIAMVNLQKNLGKNIEAKVLGGINKETKYALDYFNVEQPELLDKIEKDQKVILVDHNEFSQSVEGIENAKIEMVVDHHRISNFETLEPLYYIAKPVGCTSTILYQLYKMNNIKIENKIAGLMLSAIISDTLLFKSPTCTEEDKNAARELAEIANVNIEEYGLKMLKAGTDLDDFSEEELLNLDAKTFDKNGVKLVIAQINTVSIEDVLKREEKLRTAINNEIEKNNLSVFVFVITDILNSNSELLVLGERTDVIGKTNLLTDNKVLLKGVVSRKKQILPLIEKNI